MSDEERNQISGDPAECDDWADINTDLEIEDRWSPDGDPGEELDKYPEEEYPEDDEEFA